MLSQCICRRMRLLINKKESSDFMANYVQSFGGYIADVPKLWFKRCDGRVFMFDEQTQASVTPTVNTIDVQAGWSLFPVAVQPGQSTFDMSCTSGKFEADLFLMTNGIENFTENDAYLMPCTERLTVDATAHTVTLAHAVAKENDQYVISIDGFELGDAAAAGVYTVTAGNTGNGSVITFSADDAVTNVVVNYSYTQTVQEINIDNKTSAIGEAIMQYPVYGSGDDCTESSIIGYVNLKVYRARVTGQPGLDGSYKSASTFKFTLSAMDAKRPDGAVYSIAYVQNSKA